MLALVYGKVSNSNRHRINNLEAKYLRQNVMWYSELNTMKGRLKTLPRPIIGTKFLLLLEEEATPRNFKYTLEFLQKYEKSNAYDIIWLMGSRIRLEEYTLPTVNVLNLKASHDEDLMTSIKLELKKNILLDGVPGLIARKCGNSFERFLLYSEELSQHDIITEAIVKKVIKHKNLMPIHELVEKLTLKQPQAIKDYYAYSKRYSRRWIDNYIQDVLNKTISYKLQIARNEKRVIDLYQDQKTRRLVRLVNNTRIADVYLFRNALIRKLGVEYYLTGTPQLMIDDLVPTFE